MSHNENELKKEEEMNIYKRENWKVYKSKNKNKKII